MRECNGVKQCCPVKNLLFDSKFSFLSPDFRDTSPIPFIFSSNSDLVSARVSKSNFQNTFENFNIPSNVPLCNPSARIDDDKSVDSRFSVKIPEENVQNRLVDKQLVGSNMLKCSGKSESDFSDDKEVSLLRDCSPCKSTDLENFVHKSEPSSMDSSIEIKSEKKGKKKKKAKSKKKFVTAPTNHFFDNSSDSSSNVTSENMHRNISENQTSKSVTSNREISNSANDNQIHSEINAQNVSKHFKHTSMADKEIKSIHKGHIGDSLWIVLKLDGQRCVFLLDSGSQVSLLRNSMGKVISKTNVKITTASGAKILLDGFFDYALQIDNLSFPHRFFVSKLITENTIGTDFLVKTKSIIDLSKMRLTSKNFDVPIYTHNQLNEIQFMYILSDHTKIPCSLPEEITAQFSRLPSDIVKPARQLFIKYQHLFNSLGKAKNFCHEIVLTSDKPCKQPPRKIPFAQRAEVEKQIKELLDLGVIRRSNSEYAAPLVLVPKKSGEIRICVDYRALNSITKPDNFPVPSIDVILHNLQGSKYFATMDMLKGFHQVKIKPGDEHKTSFVVPFGQYEFLRTSFGMKNSLASFSRAVTEVLRPLIGHGLELYVDDIIVHAKTLPELMSLIAKVFELLTKEGFTLNPKKCQFFVDTIDVLGHKISANECAPLDAKLDVIRKWIEPKTKKQLRSFLGLASFYRRYVPNFSSIAAPLARLTSKKSPWLWEHSQQKAFDELKFVLQNPPVLSLFDPSKPIFIDCDASGIAVGSILSQPDENGNLHPVEYFSRCLNSAEREYCATRLELYSILLALRHWRSFILGARVTINTDHGALTWLKSFKMPESQLARWLLEISQFDVDIKYRPGKSSSNVDSLSRRPCAVDCKYCSKREAIEEMRILKSDIQIVSNLNWEVEQDKDENIKCVKEWVREGSKPEWESVSHMHPVIKCFWKQFEVLALVDNILMRKFFQPHTDFLQTIVPSHLVEELVIDIHEHGHFGIMRTKLAIQAKFFWYKWTKDVIRVVSNCKACIRRKGALRRQRPVYKKFLASEPMQRIGIDFLGPFSVTEDGNKYVLVVGDYFSKWIDFIPMRDQSAELVADALITHVFSKFGSAETIHSDQGRNFDSKLIHALCDKLAICKTRTTPYFPASNGFVERQNQIITANIAKMLRDDSQWDKICPVLSFYLRASVNSATGFSPSMLMIGREIKMPISFIAPPLKPSMYRNYDDYISELEKRIQTAYEFARKHLNIDWEKRRTAEVNPTPCKPIDVDRPVYVFNPSSLGGRNRKFQNHWVGPCEVITQLSPYLFKIKAPRNRIVVYHRRNIFQAPC
jgi:hypothetical protein